MLERAFGYTVKDVKDEHSHLVAARTNRSAAEASHTTSKPNKVRQKPQLQGKVEAISRPKTRARFKTSSRVR